MSAALRMAPAVPTSAAEGTARSSSYWPKASIRQSRQPSRTRASADASRWAGVGGGGPAGAALTGGLLHADSPSRTVRQTSRRAPGIRIELLDTAALQLAAAWSNLRTACPGFSRVL